MHKDTTGNNTWIIVAVIVIICMDSNRNFSYNIINQNNTKFNVVSLYNNYDWHCIHGCTQAGVENTVSPQIQNLKIISHTYMIRIKDIWHVHTSSIEHRFLKFLRVHFCDTLMNPSATPSLSVSVGFTSDIDLNVDKSYHICFSRQWSNYWSFITSVVLYPKY